MQLFMATAVVGICLFLTVVIGIFCYRGHWSKGRICRRCGVRLGDGACYVCLEVQWAEDHKRIERNRKR